MLGIQAPGLTAGTNNTFHNGLLLILFVFIEISFI